MTLNIYVSRGSMELKAASESAFVNRAPSYRSSDEGDGITE